MADDGRKLACIRQHQWIFGDIPNSMWSPLSCDFFQKFMPEIPVASAPNLLWNFSDRKWQPHSSPLLPPPFGVSQKKSSILANTGLPNRVLTKEDVEAWILASVEYWQQNIPLIHSTAPLTGLTHYWHNTHLEDSFKIWKYVNKRSLPKIWCKTANILFRTMFNWPKF